MEKRTMRRYSESYKKDAVKLAKDIGPVKAAKELGIPENTLNGWIRKVKDGEIDIGIGTKTPQEEISLAEKLKVATEEIKRLAKETAKQKEEIEFLSGATAFFAQRRQK